MKKILILMGVAVMLCHTSCDSKKEEKKEEIKLLVTSPLKKTQPPFTSL
jgi:membrane fusion protein (multidrug efflux system)